MWPEAESIIILIVAILSEEDYMVTSLIRQINDNWLMAQSQFQGLL